jgi:hypothetical protein
MTSHHDDPRAPSISIWAQKIRVAWQKSLDAIFAVGDLLLAANKLLPHGQFEKMVRNELPFGERTAERLMAVAADKRLRNPTHVSHLPRSWGTLYELSRLDDEQFADLLADGTINPEMTRGEAVQAAVKLEIATAATTRLREAQASAGRALSLVVEHEPAPPQYVSALDPVSEAARGRALRIWDALVREGPVDVAVSRQFKLLASEHPQDAALVREVVEGLAAAVRPK